MKSGRSFIKPYLDGCSDVVRCDLGGLRYATVVFIWVGVVGKSVFPGQERGTALKVPPVVLSKPLLVYRGQCALLRFIMN